MSTIKHGPLYLTKRLRDRMDAAGIPKTIDVVELGSVDFSGIGRFYAEGGPLSEKAWDHITPRSYDNPAWVGSQKAIESFVGNVSDEEQLAMMAGDAMLYGMVAIKGGKRVHPSNIYIGLDNACGPDWTVISEAPADLSERFSPDIAGLPEPEDDQTAWRNPWFWSAILTFYAMLISLVCLLIGG